MTDINTLIHDATIWLLIAFSIITWVFIVLKAIQTQKASKQSKHFVDEFWQAKNLNEAIQKANTEQGPTARIAQVGFQTLTDANEKTHQDLQQTWSRQDLLERHLRKQILTERRQLEKGSALLASIGNNAPFIGLFGTVFGIIHALQAIAQSGNASMDVVAGPIGEALIATGIGIAVAVPAVLAYNYFVRKVKSIGADLDDFATDFVSLNQKAGFQLPSATAGINTVTDKAAVSTVKSELGKEKEVLA
ncbi:MotA/TolQ/ExbB proton channel family protein [Acinetobacter puyangensis]|uniref:Outer membrane transport energization protein ExbB n=1 Tax=Acinetobacter puyangensis TaxID=1096779 RepID=A0A240EBP4_9GAMM|nr:MotA/TolQ/ExbB proton channel family protein [Acinetobacter puyangensis]SNX45961.1 outer membrane transport energization protein ExbB [Acinetobacter puyangensis]